MDAETRTDQNTNCIDVKHELYNELGVIISIPSASHACNDFAIT